MSPFEFSLLSVAWWVAATHTRSGFPSIVCLLNSTAFGIAAVVKLLS